MQKFFEHLQLKSSTELQFMAVTFANFCTMDTIFRMTKRLIVEPYTNTEFEKGNFG